MDIICNFTYSLNFTYFHDIVYISIDILYFIEFAIVKNLF